MKRTSFGLLGTVTLLATIPVVTGCKKEEPPPPLPTAAPVTAAPAPLQLKPEDAGVRKAPPDAAAPKKAGGSGSGGGSLAACCAALQQNAASAPPPNNTYMLQAAAVCKAAVSNGQGKAALSGIVAMLKGVGIPATCK